MTISPPCRPFFPHLNLAYGIIPANGSLELDRNTPKVYHTLRTEMKPLDREETPRMALKVLPLNLLFALSAILTVRLAAAESSEPPWGALWILDPLFRDARPVNLFHKEKVEPELPPHDKNLQNVHSYFRREFDLSAGVRTARLRITADDYYHLYVNGRFVGQGPAPGYVFAYPFNEYDLAPHLRTGRNVLAVHVYYQGLVNRVWGSGDLRQGMIAELDGVLKDGSKVQVVTDGNWKVLTSTAYKGRRTTGYRTQFLEDVDARLVPRGWKEVGFDDTAWSSPVARSVADTGYTLVAQVTPPLQVEKVPPTTLRRLADGHYLADFGTELTGTVGLRVTGPAGHRIQIRHGEEMESSDRVRWRMRANCDYRDTWTLAGEPNEQVQLFDYKGFRYLELLNVPSAIDRDDVWVLRRHYPFDPNRSSFRSSDPLLDRIWSLCVNGVRYGCQEVFVDCPTREKGQYLGDTYVTALSHLYAQGDPRLTRKAIQDFAHSSRVCPGLLAVAPGSFMQEIADYSLQWPMLLQEYYHHTGDEAFVREVAPVLDGLLDYFRRYENANGLLENVDEKWNLVDWPENLRDDYDYDRAVKGVNTVLNAFYQGALAASSELAEVAGNPQKATELRQIAAKHADVFQRLLFDPETGLAIDALGSTHSSLHANALALYFGLVPQDRRDPVIKHLHEKRMSCGVYMSFFLLRTLFDAGEEDFAYDLITSKDERSWHTMLAAGATTCMEAWGPDQKWNTSWCHPWSSAPVSLVAGRIMGLRPDKPGWRELDFAPQTPRALANAEIVVTTPLGRVTASHRVIDVGAVEYTIETPDGMPIRLRPPAIKRRPAEVTADGVMVAGELSGGYWRATTALPAGKHDIRVRW